MASIASSSAQTTVVISTAERVAAEENSDTPVPTLEFEVSFSGQKTVIRVPETYSVGDLKTTIEELTEVPAEGQKLIGLPKFDSDAALLSSMAAIKRPLQKIMLMGTRPADAEAFKAAAGKAQVAFKVLDDMVDDDEEAETLEVHRNEEFLALIDKRVTTFKPEPVAGFRPNSRTLVLDIDYTLMDHRTAVTNPVHMARPYLHQFLTVAYARGYDIVIWSATSLSWAKLKMRDLGVLSHSHYKIAGFMHSHAMIQVNHPTRGRVDVKPLGVLWKQFPEASDPRTTIMFDDLRRNFLMNPQNGLKIAACRNLPAIRHTDRELLHLAAYLALISSRRNDFSALDHRKWKRYLLSHGLDVESPSVSPEEVALYIDSLPAPKPVCWASATTTVTTSTSSTSSSSSSSGDGASGAGGAGAGSA